MNFKRMRLLPIAAAIGLLCASAVWAQGVPIQKAAPAMKPIVGPEPRPKIAPPRIILCPPILKLITAASPVPSGWDDMRVGYDAPLKSSSIVGTRLRCDYKNDAGQFDAISQAAPAGYTCIANQAPISFTCNL